MYLRWQTNAEEMKKVNPNVTFIAVVDYQSGWYEEADTYDKAIEIMRDLIESDGHHVLVRIDRWRGSNGNRHAQAKMTSIMTWCNTLTGKMESKTIKANGINYGMISKYQRKQEGRE